MNNTRFYEIYDFWYQPFWETLWFQVGAGGFALLVILLLSWWVIRRIRRRRAEKKLLLPWEWAFDEVADLTPTQYTSKEAFKQFYFHLTLVIKTYLQKRYGWSLEHKTDKELISYLTYKKFAKSLLKDLKVLFESAAQVKFADMEALPMQAGRDLQTVYEVIRKTIPQEDDIETKKPTPVKKKVAKTVKKTVKKSVTK